MAWGKLEVPGTILGLSALLFFKSDDAIFFLISDINDEQIYIYSVPKNKELKNYPYYTLPSQVYPQ
jgi:hypothetical protein